MSDPAATIIGALIGFVGGLVAARAAYQQKADELFFKALDFLGGGSQNRNLGIAAIELYWSNKRHRPVSVSLLIGTALYLLAESKQEGAAHELHNLDRIMMHLLRKESRDATSQWQYQRLLAAIKAAKDPTRTGGLRVPKEQLESWEKAIDYLIGSSGA
jgi:hypothetical protein